VTAGASAPEVLVQELLDSLRTRFGFGRMEEVELKEEDVRFQLPAGLEQSAMRLTQIAPAGLGA
jgi:4-hydroxy-3-methylbut-2-enyl diphosphate reductase